MFNINFGQWLDSNRGPLDSEPTALPTEPCTFLLFEPVRKAISIKSIITFNIDKAEFFKCCYISNSCNPCSAATQAWNEINLVKNTKVLDANVSLK